MKKEENIKIKISKDDICYDSKTFEPCMFAKTKMCYSCAILSGNADFKTLFESAAA